MTDIDTLFNMVNSLVDRVGKLEEEICWLEAGESSSAGNIFWANPYMTAVQFADHNDLGDVDLNVLGKLAKEVAGASYNKIPHTKFGTVGYVQLSIWVEAYRIFKARDGVRTVLSHLLNRDIPSDTEDRGSIERLAAEYSKYNRLRTGVGYQTHRHPEGAPLFTAEAIDGALRAYLVLKGEKSESAHSCSGNHAA